LWWAETVMFFVMIGFITTDIAPIGHNVEWLVESKQKNSLLDHDWLKKLCALWWLATWRKTSLLLVTWLNALLRPPLSLPHLLSLSCVQ
jgi:hypothetical protein